MKVMVCGWWDARRVGSSSQIQETLYKNGKNSSIFWTYSYKHRERERERLNIQVDGSNIKKEEGFKYLESVLGNRGGGGRYRGKNR